jgi:hypothetical protein
MGRAFMASIGKKKRARDANQLAYQILMESTGQVDLQAPEEPDTRNPAAVALSKARRKGRKEGRKARENNKR